MIYHNIRLKNQPIFFGHRGAPRLIHENTIQSLEKAIALGCNGVETDIQTTKDKKIKGEFSAYWYRVIRRQGTGVSIC